MKNLFKKIVCISLAFCLTLGLTACSGIFTPVGGQESNSAPNMSGLPDGVDINFEINVTNSLDIVPDGVAVLDVIRPSVVEIYSMMANAQSSGSGVVLSMADEDGDGVDDKAIIVTCHHVIDSAYEVIVKAIDGKEYKATLVGTDPDSDLAVLFIQATSTNAFENLTSATWYDRSSNLKVGTEVYAIGNPLGTLGGTVTSGIISAINRDVTVEDTQMTLIQTDAAINGGNSGGGLFDKNTGALIGIVNAGYASSTAQGLSFAIPGNVAIDILSQLISNGYIEGRYDFGVEFGLFKTSSWVSTEYYVGITALEDFGLFQKNGFKEKDIIKSIKIGDREEFVVPQINSLNVNTIVADLTAYVNDENCKIGDTVLVNYRRYYANSGYLDQTASFKVEQFVYGE
ncbi:MAG: trypsin-like peptidase domain-containing protein [Clostridia bacterium]|nr:trypsin-like peptidase domain-containing protein [Clostridia bacterium]